MNAVVPHFAMATEPETWDLLTYLAATVFLEAEGEPNEGKVAVAWVIRNRADQWKQAMSDVIRQPWQFSCWNEDYRPRALARLSGADSAEAEQAWRAAAGAIWRLIADPVAGSCHYLNVVATQAGRKKHDLPEWADLTKTVAVIGRHHFLKL